MFCNSSTGHLAAQYAEGFEIFQATCCRPLQGDHGDHKMQQNAGTASAVEMLRKQKQRIIQRPKYRNDSDNTTHATGNTGIRA
jgi:hypothetical protein